MTTSVFLTSCFTAKIKYMYTNFGIHSQLQVWNQTLFPIYQHLVQYSAECLPVSYTRSNHSAICRSGKRYVMLQGKILAPEKITENKS